MDSIVYPQLTPSFHGSMARCLDLLRFALLHTTSFPSSFVPSSTEHRLFSTYDALAVTFVRSFVRVTLGESTLPFRRLQCATVPLFSTLLSLLSGTSSLPHSSSPPDHLLPTLSPSSCLPLFLGHVFPWPTGIFPPLFFPYIRMYI